LSIAHLSTDFNCQLNNVSQSIESLFTKAGGQFCIPAADIQRKLENIKAFVFDWDGVFNDGSKRDQTGSGFTEPDAMGTNILRFSYWLKNKSLPITAIITGEENESALFLAKREHFTSLFFKASNKLKSFEHFLNVNKLQAKEVAFVFDDVLDLAVASQCGLRIAAYRESNPLFNQHIAANQLADYMTSSAGGKNAVREACELLIGLHGNYDEVISNRMRFSETYQQYLHQRQQVEATIFNGIN
jgi:3-deoxy-D-manno-octulosonate 8-phosphate phosphatase (KDO 8-P phosphatase)